MKCPACGYENKDDDLVCGMCNAVLKKEQEEPPSTTPDSKVEEPIATETGEETSNTVSESDKPAEPKSLKNVILTGLGIMVVGLLTAGVAVGYVVLRVNTGAESVIIPDKIIMFGVGLSVLGLFYMVSGGSIKKVIADPNTDLSAIKWYQWLFLLVCVAIALVCYFYIEKYLEGLGFTRTF